MKMTTRKATMTNRERVWALLRREKPDRVVLRGGGGGFAMLYSGYSIAEMYTLPLNVVYEIEKKACHDFDWVFMPSFGSRRAGSYGAFGAKMKLPTNKYAQSPYAVKYVAETPEEVMALKIPDVKAVAEITPEVIDCYKLSCQDEDENKPFNANFGCLSPIVSGGFIPGPEKMCKWMVKEPEVVHRLFRLATDLQIELAQYFKNAFGVERVLPTGSHSLTSNQLVSPKHFEQFALPYIQETHERVLAMGFKHLQTHPCGEQNRNLPGWQQVPMGDPGIVHIGSEVDLATAAKYFPNDIIMGNLDPIIIQEGTPDEIYEATSKVIEQGKNLPTGFILSPGCGLPPRASVENVMAVTRAVNDFGWYD